MVAIYRKYRPGTFSDLLGQETIIRVLREAAKQDKLAHAYLLSGPRGTGKTTTARIIAKIANCSNLEKNKTGEPCNQCESCGEINDGKSLDIIEIDGASNRGIDEIRDLKESVRVAPAKSRFKVFIIDEAHMLTKDAFNALLKTLEEPPEHIILILATTETEKIPVTISSRTQQFHFKKIHLQEIVNKLKRIAEIEGIKISAEALELIAASAEGSFRDAESLFDQLITFNADKSISLQNIEAIVGKVGFHQLSDFAETLLQNNVEKCLSLLSEINNHGYNLAQFVKDLINYLRKVAVLKYNKEMVKDFQAEMMEEHLNILFKQSLAFKDEHINLLKNLIKAYGEMRYSQFPIIPLEVALIESMKK